MSIPAVIPRRGLLYVIVTVRGYQRACYALKIELLVSDKILSLVSDKKHNNPCNSLIIRQHRHFNSWWAWFFIIVAYFSSPSKIEGVRGSMTESRCCFSNCFHTPQSLRDSSPILREQLSPFSRTLIKFYRLIVNS